jgi:hypothetical protein
MDTSLISPNVPPLNVKYLLSKDVNKFNANV